MVKKIKPPARSANEAAWEAALLENTDWFACHFQRETDSVSLVD
jgi:hypothetical protein